MFGEINVYEAALTVHECAANVINRAHLVSLLQGFDAASLPRPPPRQKPDTHRKTETAICPLHQVRNLGHRLQISFF